MSCRAVSYPRSSAINNKERLNSALAGYVIAYATHQIKICNKKPHRTINIYGTYIQIVPLK